MSYITRNLKQRITYWSPGNPNDFSGRSFGIPSSLNGRWEDKSVLFIDSFGNEARASSVVYLDSDVIIQGYLYLGESTNSSPLNVSGAKEIRDIRKTPNLAATEFERKVLL